MSEGIIREHFKKRMGHHPEVDEILTELQADIIAEIEKLHKDYLNDTNCLDCFDQRADTFHERLIGKEGEVGE